jgi:hypothetical protein
MVKCEFRSQPLGSQRLVAVRSMTGIAQVYYRHGDIDRNQRRWDS